MTLSDITVRIFMRCLFDKNYEGVDNWDELYTSYIDTSGLGKEGELPLHIAIHNLNARLLDITSFLEFQSKVYRLVKMPHIPRMGEINKYGHRLTWDPQNDNFLDQLNAVDLKERRNYVEMKKLQKELKQIQQAQTPNTVSARNQFVIMLNTLGKEGYKIGKDKTDMLELSLMIKQHGLDVEAAKQG